MCQLTFINHGNEKLNQVALYLQFLVNTQTSNKDGFGIFNGKRISKSGFDVNTIIDFGRWVPEFVHGEPVIAHVRLATAVKGVKTVDADSAHPFESEKFVVAHNGMLEFKDPKRHDAHKGITVDSQLFLNELTSAYDGTNLVKAIQNTVDLFYGTFAFLIYCKPENRYIVVRGWTKKLHSATVTFTRIKSKEETKGLIVNTDKFDLSTGLKRFKAMVEIIGGIQVAYTEPEELKSETMYEVVGTDLVELGKVKEAGKPAANFTPANSATGTTTFGRTGTTGEITGETRKETSFRLHEVLNRWGYSFQEFDLASQVLWEKGYFASNLKEINATLTLLDSISSQNYTPGKNKIWLEICECYQDPSQVYADFSYLRFPYVVNSLANLARVLKELYPDAQTPKS